MDKVTFLEELRKYLHVLQDEEIQDIIGEYEQHIDLKVKNGQTEEQAIVDFGNIKELAIEILEGYHVKADFGVPADERDEKKSILSTGHEMTKSITKKVWIWLEAFWKWILHGFVWCGKQVKRPFVWIKMKWNNRRSHNENMVTEKRSIDRKGWIVNKTKGLGNMILQIWNWIIRASVWCVRICWNSCIVGTALMLGGFGLIFLFIVGMFVVLLMQGYPFIGVTIGSVGLVLCLFAVTVLVWSMIWHKSKPTYQKVENTELVNDLEIETEEGQHA